MRARLAVGVACWTFLLCAQDYWARVQGLVTDSTGAVVAGARVTLTNTNTGVEAVRESNANGQHLFDFVEPGTYQLAAELAGFARFVQQGILVQVRGDVTVDAVLRSAANAIAENTFPFMHPSSEPYDDRLVGVSTQASSDTCQRKVRRS